MATQQSVELRTQIWTAWEKSKWFPRPENGKPLLLLTEHNIRKLREETDDKDISVSSIVAIVDKLTQTKELQYDQPRIVEKIVERIVEVEKPKTPQEIAQEKRDLAARAGIYDKYGQQPRTEFDRPSRRQQELLDIQRSHADIANSEAARIALEHLISTHSVDGAGGRTNHSETARQKERLKAILITDSNGKPDYRKMLQEARDLQYKMLRLDSSIR